jgi:cold shock CspA family protein
VQATVHRFDPDTGAGTVLLDDGLDVPFDAAAWAGSGLRHLRSGQRLDVVLEGSGAAVHAVSLRLHGLDPG